METKHIELTPEQKGVLASLAEETGESAASLIDTWLDELQERLRASRVNGGQAKGNPPVQETPKPIWEQFADAFEDVPEEELERLPTDLASNVDHYVYGLPKRNP